MQRSLKENHSGRVGRCTVILSGHKGSNKTVIWNESLTSLANIQVSGVNEELWSSYMYRHGQDTSHQTLRWFGMRTVKELREAVELYGWSKGVAKAKSVIKSFESPKLPQYRRKRVWGSQGHTLDIHRVLAGDLDHAWQSSHREVSNRLAMKGTVNIVIDIGSNQNVNNITYFWRGAVGLMLAQSLIKSGRSVRIIAVDCTSRATLEDVPNMNKLIIATVIKGFSESLNINKLFSVTSLSGFYRYYYFKAQLSIPCRANDSFGTAVDFDVDDIDYFLDSSPCLVISNIWSEQQANSKLQSLAKQIEGGSYE